MFKVSGSKLVAVAVLLAAVLAIATHISLTDVNGMVLAAMTVPAVLDVLARDAIMQTELVTTAGISVLASTRGHIMLNKPLNDFFGVVSAGGKSMALTDVTGLAVTLNSLGNSAWVAGGDLMVRGTTYDLATTTTSAGRTIFETTVGTGALNLNSAGTANQTGVLTVIWNANPYLVKSVGTIPELARTANFALA